MHTLYAYNAEISSGIAFVNSTLIYWCSCNLLIVFQIYLERVYFLRFFSIGKLKVSPKPHQNFCTDVFFDNFDHNCRRLIFYWTHHGSCLFKVRRFVDAENVLLWKLSSSRKFNLHVVYIFESAWNSVTKFWHSDQRLSRNSSSLLYCMLGVLACLQVCVLDVLACLHALRTRVLTRSCL